MQPDLNEALFVERSGTKNLSADRQSGSGRRKSLPLKNIKKIKKIRLCQMSAIKENRKG